MQDLLQIGSRQFQSRLLVGTGKYKDLNETDQAIQASGAEIVTVAIRRVKYWSASRPTEPAFSGSARKIHHFAKYSRLF